MFAALICLLLSEKHSRTTEKQELVFLNAVLPEKKHEGCSNNSRRARRGSNNGPAKEGGKRENKAAGAHAAACVLVLTAEAKNFLRLRRAIQANAAAKPLPHGIAQLTEAALGEVQGRPEAA